MQRKLFIPNTTSLKFVAGKTIKFDMQYYNEEYAKTWNSIPLELRTIRSKAMFSKKLKSYLLEKQQREINPP